MKSKIFFFSFLFVGALSYAKRDRKPVPPLPDKASLEVPYQQTKMVRVDPHGAKNVKPTADQARQQNECQVCHSFQGNELVTKPAAVETCFNCHNKSPHSGVQEHAKVQVSCIDCHTLHRGSAVAWTGPSGMFKDLTGPKLDQGLTQKNSASPMLKKTCTECHKNQK